MRDPITPPAARRPEEALELVAQALSDGDIEAALAQYEDDARFLLWESAEADLRAAMTWLMALRLPLSLHVKSVLQVSGLAIVSCHRRIAGTGPDCQPVLLSGHGFAAIRPQPDGTWRIAVDAWSLPSPENPLAPPEDPPEAYCEPVQGEGPRRAASTT
jgi:ketosteroid isomerase-like protein